MPSIGVGVVFQLTFSAPRLRGVDPLLGLERLHISPGPPQLLLQLWHIYFGRVVDDLIRFVKATPSRGD